MSRSPEQLEAYLRRTAAALLETEARLERERAERREPIAIVGVGCRLPGGVSNPDALWSLLAAGRDAIGPLPERWSHLALFDRDPDAPGKCYAREGGFLDEIDRFDAAFFGISPREARWMDPQQRIALEVAWHALEDTGIRPSSLHRTRTGVFLGTMGSDYALAARSELAMLSGYQSTGNASSVLSGRLSYHFGLNGPSLTIDTACSSSLVALHLACESLRRGESDVVLAGGVTVMCEPAALVEFSRLKGLSPGGRCRSFAADADGMAWAEGCGLVVLKRLSSARRDGDRVRAIIRGSAVNQDGRSQGLTAPNGPAQERVIHDALRVSGLEVDDIDAIEAHGTGTSLGDPIEAGALVNVFATRSVVEPVHLGSIKSNLGHTQAAAGVVGLIKMVLALEHEQLPATLHATSPTPLVDWAASKLQLVQTARPWPRRDRDRRAGISAFGISGTNAHVVIEEAPAPEAPGAVTAGGSIQAPVAVPVVLSATDPRALAIQAAQLDRWLDIAEPRLVDLAFTRAACRDAL
ncbi:MAG TPA: beta-ketoacyl synthase N-terminal-like domain-containing protein, partial [Kofleriaceae bacterium]